MIRQDIDILGYWTIIIVYDIYLGEKNSGFTHTNFNKRLSIVGIGKADSKKQFLNTIVHEAKHIQSHICNYYDVNEDSEDAAYLIGYIVMKMYECFKNYLCQ
jgi:hypothetical protein